jgi:peptidoglycan hydrolase CwlO-like protein
MKHFSLFNKVMLIYAIFVAVYGCTILVNTGGSSVHIEDSNSPKNETSSQIGRDIDKLQNTIQKVEKTTEKTNDRVKQVKETTEKTNDRIKQVKETVIKTDSTVTKEVLDYLQNEEK